MICIPDVPTKMKIVSLQQEEILAQRKNLEQHYTKLMNEQSKKHEEELREWRKKVLPTSLPFSYATSLLRHVLRMG